MTNTSNCLLYLLDFNFTPEGYEQVDDISNKSTIESQSNSSIQSQRKSSIEAQDSYRRSSFRAKAEQIIEVEEGGTRLLVYGRQDWFLGRFFYILLCIITAGIYFLLSRWFPLLQHALCSRKSKDFLSSTFVLIKVFFILTLS